MKECSEILNEWQIIKTQHAHAGIYLNEGDFIRHICALHKEDMLSKMPEYDFQLSDAYEELDRTKRIMEVRHLRLVYVLHNIILNHPDSDAAKMAKLAIHEDYRIENEQQETRTGSDGQG